MKNEWKFEVGEAVKVYPNLTELYGSSASTDLYGFIDGRAEYGDGTRSYLVRFVDNDGMPQSDWFDEHLLGFVQPAIDRENP